MVSGDLGQKSALMGLHVKLRTKGVSLLARGVEVVLVLYDNLERQIRGGNTHGTFDAVWVF